MLNYNREQKIQEINGVLKLRTKIEEVVDEICDKGYKNLCFLGVGGPLSTGRQVYNHMKEYSDIDVFYQSAPEYMTTGNRKITKDTIVVISSVSGTTKEMIEVMEYLNENIKCRTIGFIDTVNSKLYNMVDYCLTYDMNESLKFFMLADRFMHNEKEIDFYDDMYKEFDDKLAVALADVEEQSDKFALDYATKHWQDDIHYFVGAGNLHTTAYFYAMCVLEEQHWIKTKSIHSSEFFHGMFEIVERDTPITLYIGEDSQRSLSERVARFLPKVCANYTIIDTKDYELNGIKQEYRKHISHLVVNAINNRIDVHIEKISCHPMVIRRYYKQFDY